MCAPSLILALLAAAAPAQDVRPAIARALPLLQRSAASFVKQRACVSCHHNILPILMLHLARERGIAIDSAVLGAVEDKTFRELRGPHALDDAIQAANLNDPTPDDSFLLMAANTAGIPPDLTTGVLARRLARWQRDGHWVTSDFRPPHSSSTFTATASAVRAIRLYMPLELRAERDDCLLRARRWLSATRPASTEDAAFRLMGLVWSDAAPAEIAAARRDLIAMRKPSGAWPELPAYPPDAYSTGESLFALRAAGMPLTDPVWRKAAAFLISTQAAGGSWRVHTRMISPAPVSPEYFSTGFPYEKDEYLSYAASCWAVMALLTALPESPSPPAVIQTAPEPEPWIRTALFGTPHQLSALDPNAKTAAGTTVLMMAAPDPERVKLLIARGADAKARAASGYDALTIAAAYRHTAPSLQLLLEAGAELHAPPGKRLRNSPLVLAAMSGDLENVKLLLAHGADPSPALGQAVTFGYADIARTLLEAGASATATESTGINLLHWATIANRPDLIPILARAGAYLNSTDDFGFTPLMYAATIDFGDTASAQALLHAGADPSIRNLDGRIPREQARRLGHTTLAASLPR